MMTDGCSVSRFASAGRKEVEWGLVGGMAEGLSSSSSMMCGSLVCSDVSSLILENQSVAGKLSKSVR